MLFLLGFWIWWIPDGGVRKALECYVIAVGCFFLGYVPLGIYILTALILFIIGRVMWRKCRSKRMRILAITMAYSPLLLCAVLPFFVYLGE